MSSPIQYIRRGIAAKPILMVGLTLFVIVFAWVRFNIAHHWMGGLALVVFFVTAVIISFFIISDRKRMAAALDQSEKKYQAIFNNIPYPVFVLDMNTLGVLDCNKNTQAVYGYTQGELIGTSFPNLFPARDRADFTRNVHTSGVLDRVKHHHKTGRPLIVNLRISPSEYQGQRVFLVTSSDITQRLEVEQQLIQAGKMATLGEMATGIAHELNQPLSVIKTASSFCIGKIQRNEPIAPDHFTNLLTKVDNNVDRATRIITHLRQFARKSEIKLEMVQINEVIKNAVDIFSQQLKARGIELISETDPDVPKIRSEPTRLEQVFINLLVNARDAIEEKWAASGPISNNNRITITTRATNASVTASVRDTGAGIPADILNKIFDPFFTTKEVGKGTGLGLSISSGIVKEHGGEITARSLVAGGACFVLSFPIAGNHGNERSLP